MFSMDSYELGLYQYQHGDYIQAEGTVQRTLEKTESEYGSLSMETLKCKHLLGCIYYYLRKYHLAKPLLLLVVQSNAVINPGDPSNMFSNYWLAMTMFSLKEYLAAEPIFREVVESWRSLDFYNHQYTLIGRGYHGASLYHLEKYRESNELLRGVVSDWATLPLSNQNGEHRDHIQRYWACSVYHIEDYRTAEQMFKGYLNTGGAMMAFPDEWAVLWTGRTLFQLGRLIEAKTYFQMAYPGFERMGKHREEYYGACFWFGVTLHKLGNTHKAEELLREALSGTESLLGIGHDVTFKCKHGLGCVLYDQKRYVEAWEYLQYTMRQGERLKHDDPFGIHYAKAITSINPNQPPAQNIHSLQHRSSPQNQPPQLPPRNINGFPKQNAEGIGFTPQYGQVVSNGGTPMLPPQKSDAPPGFSPPPAQGYTYQQSSSPQPNVNMGNSGPSSNVPPAMHTTIGGSPIMRVPQFVSSHPNATHANIWDPGMHTPQVGTPNFPIRTPQSYPYSALANIAAAATSSAKRSDMSRFGPQAQNSYPLPAFRQPAAGPNAPNSGTAGFAPQAPQYYPYYSSPMENEARAMDQAAAFAIKHPGMNTQSSPMQNEARAMDRAAAFAIKHPGPPIRSSGADEEPGSSSNFYALLSKLKNEEDSGGSLSGTRPIASPDFATISYQDRSYIYNQSIPTRPIDDCFEPYNQPQGTPYEHKSGSFGQPQEHEDPRLHIYDYEEDPQDPSTSMFHPVQDGLPDTRELPEVSISSTPSPRRAPVEFSRRTTPTEISQDHVLATSQYQHVEPKNHYTTGDALSDNALPVPGPSDISHINGALESLNLESRVHTINTLDSSGSRPAREPSFGSASQAGVSLRDNRSTSSMSQISQGAEAKLNEYFAKDPSDRKSYTDAEIHQISTFLKHSNVKWYRVPRTYIVLRIIGHLDLLDILIKEGFSDYMLPASAANMPTCLSMHARTAFVETQKRVITVSMDLEKGGAGQHCHFEEEADIPFERITILGNGGFGEVDKVLSKNTYREYARKRVPRARIFKRGIQSMKYFVTEIELLKRLQQHRHVVDFVGSYTDPKYIGLIMSPVADMDLVTYLEDINPSKYAELRTFFGCLAMGLSFLHDQKVRHKDIKPQNILIKGGRVLITDFGLALDFTNATKGSKTSGFAVGTARYFAPELALQEPRNRSADMWSLGIVFMEMIVALKGQGRGYMDSFFKARGAENLFIRSNLSTFPDLVKQLKETGASSANKPLAWAQEMLAREPANRPTASTLASTIIAAGYDEGPKFYGGCCVKDDDDD